MIDVLANLVLAQIDLAMPRTADQLQAILEGVALAVAHVLLIAAVAGVLLIPAAIAFGWLWGSRDASIRAKESRVWRRLLVTAAENKRLRENNEWLASQLERAVQRKTNAVVRQARQPVRLAEVRKHRA